MAIAEVRKSDRGNALSKMKGINFTDLLVPALFIMILGLVTFFVFLPSIESSKDMKDQIDELNRKQSVLDENLKKMEPLMNNKTQLLQDLNKTSKILPKKMEVGTFAYLIDNIAKESGLEFREITQRDCLQAATSVDRFEGASSVCGPISYVGEYQEIVAFLDILQDRSPYIVEVVKLEMSSSKSNEEDDAPAYWNLEIDLSGYYMPGAEEITIGTLYQPFIPYTSYSDMMTIFDYKYSQLDRLDTTNDSDEDELVDPNLESEE